MQQLAIPTISIAQPMACRPRLGQQKAFNNTALRNFFLQHSPARSCILTVENPSIKSSRGVKCNFTKQPVDQHRFTCISNIYRLLTFYEQRGFLNWHTGILCKIHLALRLPVTLSRQPLAQFIGQNGAHRLLWGTSKSACVSQWGFWTGIAFHPSV